jgi:hypothetical protein
MKFEQFNQAIDTVKEMVGVDEEIAINIVSKLCDIFELKASESSDELIELVVKLLLEKR